MADPADLLISLFHQAGDQYNVDLHYRRPGVESELPHCRGVAVFDEKTLNELRSKLKPEEHGRLLRQALFKDPNLVTYFINSKINANDALRIRLQVDPDASKLLNLRWEMLVDLDERDFLALNAKCPFSRFYSTSNFERIELRSKGDLRLLMVVANPRELSRQGGFVLDTGIPLAEA
jgi:hypothetical protein